MTNKNRHNVNIRTNGAARRLTLPELWNKYYLWIAAIAIPVIIAVVTIIATTFITNRYNENRIHDYGRTKLYASYTVQSGDTLWSISADMAETMPEYPTIKVYLKDLKNSNNMYTDKIYEGDVLQLPYFVDSERVTDDILANYGIITK